MRIPSDSELIAIWEMRRGRTPGRPRAHAALACFRAESLEEVARLSIGARDARLIEIYEYLFGPSLDAFAQCPACAEAARVQPLHPRPHGTAKSSSAASTLEAGEFRVELRLPDSLDLCAVSGCSDLTQAGRLLMERCVVAAKVDGGACTGRGPAGGPDGGDRVEAGRGGPIGRDADRSYLPGVQAPVAGLARYRALSVDEDFRASQAPVARGPRARIGLWLDRARILALSPARRQSYLEMAWQTS